MLAHIRTRACVRKPSVAYFGGCRRMASLPAHNMAFDESKQAGRVVYAAAERNKAPILDVLSPYLNQASRVLEIASGSGQHISHWATTFPSVQFQPSELSDPLLHTSIQSYAQDHPNISPPLALNVTSDSDWSNLHTSVERTGPFDLVYAGNLLHISSWGITLSLAKHVPAVLSKPTGKLILYGPFKRDGAFTTESNKDFDKSLRERSSEWGLRDIADVSGEFEKHGLALEKIVDMPANNFILVFRLTDTA
ncbi:hypothetical protein HDU85_007476 [Gaertneriomyces sp. JEL0708]|nr:hypothetical protein HDU85_007476 [Gaertneriomyces sp. JEL0708]